MLTKEAEQGAVLVAGKDQSLRSQPFPPPLSWQIIDSHYCLYSHHSNFEAIQIVSTQLYGKH